MGASLGGVVERNFFFFFFKRVLYMENLGIGFYFILLLLFLSPLQL